MFIIRQLSFFLLTPMNGMCFLLVCCFSVCSQKKRILTIKHGPVTTYFSALFTDWKLWDSVLCKDCLATLSFCSDSFSSNGSLKLIRMCLCVVFFFFLLSSEGEKIRKIPCYEYFFTDITSHTSLWGKSIDSRRPIGYKQCLSLQMFRQVWFLELYHHRCSWLKVSKIPS